MSWATAFVLIFMIAAAWGIWSSRQNTAHQEPTDNQSAAEREAEQRELEELRERVKVLERIAYDANNSSARERDDIAKQIEQLRDE